MYLKDTGWEGMNWIHLAQDRNKWQALATKVMNCYIIVKFGSSFHLLFILFQGIYQPSQTTEYNEDSQGESFDFLSRLCHEWENAAKLPADLGVRQVTVRAGNVPITVSS